MRAEPNQGCGDQAWLHHRVLYFIAVYLVELNGS